ncbi:AlkA N-terminal domain-containing protein [Ornithinimicrobium sediminis]|uniref:AlkA N-terminal domain-containing protein n=1 Tax=Ornithinimicrobium sediminis TaxID=2904603 RepID=UPI001E51CCFF|nr:AlkA N-terminal domain-containing protein [Ornithinimicrobium sediminis]MCE0485795.1 helix-turn-helix domain-containing protein [Ornithinimicrobium sediminis]
MHTDHEACAAAVRSRDPRFDGWFYTAVVTTGIYCRPSCPAMTPHTRNMRFYPSAAAAQGAGFRACKRCRPDATPGSPQWHTRGDLVARAMRLIADGVVDSEGVEGLARRLGYSPRQVERLVTAELGAGPLALARAQRAQTARTLIETTALPMADVAFAAGFSSIRSFNDTVQAVFATTPSALRGHGRARRPGAGTAHRLTVRLPHRSPLHADSLFGHLAATLVPHVERWHDGGLERTLRLPHAPGRVHLRPAEGHVLAALTLLDLRDLTAAIHRCRRLLDLDADPVAVDTHLAADPVLAPLVGARPGVRIPGTVDPAEMALRVVLGQQISTRAASTLAGRIVQRVGDPLPPALREGEGPDHLFPEPAALAGHPTEDLPGMPPARLRTLLTLAAALGDGSLRLGPDTPWSEARAALHDIPGIGPWTAEMVALRGLGDPDAFPATDLAVRATAVAHGLPGDVRALVARSAAWRPWRSYVTQTLWASSGHAAARTPDPTPPSEQS